MGTHFEVCVCVCWPVAVILTILTYLFFLSLLVFQSILVCCGTFMYMVVSDSLVEASNSGFRSVN